MNTTLVIVVIAVAVYDFTNGFHDAADMVATAIASRAIRPAIAIGIVSLFTLIAPFTVGLAVADTIGSFVDISASSYLAGESVVVAALAAAHAYTVFEDLVYTRKLYPANDEHAFAVTIKSR